MTPTTWKITASGKDHYFIKPKVTEAIKEFWDNNPDDRSITVRTAHPLLQLSLN